MSEIRELIEQENFSEAIRALEAYVRALPPEGDSNAWIWAGRFLEEIPASFVRGCAFKRVALLGGYTTSYLAPILRAQAFRRGLWLTITECEYGSLESWVMGENSPLTPFKPDLVYFCVGTPHIQGTPDAEVMRWARLAESVRTRFGAETLLNLFVEPAERAFGNEEARSPSQSARVRELNAGLRARTLKLFDTEGLAAWHGHARFSDPRAYDLAKTPCPLDLHPAYARALSAVMTALFGRAKKCAIVDLDGLLWGGVVGDDGVDGIRLSSDTPDGEAHLRLQRYLRGLKDRGIVLAVCSKNELALAQAPFRERPEMILKLEDFACFIANWRPKSENVIEIASRLGLGLSSMVFLDDHPAERENVRQALPGVEVLDLPDDPSAYAQIVSQSGWFETVGITEEDQTRAGAYQAELVRTDTAALFRDYGEYLASLEMKASIAPFDARHQARIAQLINKTNQFNLTTRRYSEPEVSALAERPEVLTRYVKLSDKFGDSGLVGALIARIDPSNHEVAEIDTWLMSCRVLNRGVENVVFKELLDELRDQGVRCLRASYHPTDRNSLVREHYDRLGFTLREETSDGTRHYELRLDSESLPEWTNVGRIDIVPGRDPSLAN